jgi:hydroxyacylglutathione hydrolase
MRINSHLAIVGSAQFALSGPYDCHVYAILCPEGIVLIDAASGLNENEIVDHLLEDFPDVPVAAVVVTHSHMDHSGGAAGLRARFGCRIFTSDLSAPILSFADEDGSGLKRARERGTYPPDLQMKPCPPDATYQDGEQIQIGGRGFHAVRVRGHSDDSFCLLTELDGRLACFSGDAVFYGGILGVINANDSGMQGYLLDLPKLAGSGIELLLPGHGLFTLKNGQKHIDAALDAMHKGFLPMQIGQGAIIF